MTEHIVCEWCEHTAPHYHTLVYPPNGEAPRDCIVFEVADPRAEVRDPDTGEVIFPAKKGPLRLIQGGLDTPHSAGGEGS